MSATTSPETTPVVSTTSRVRWMSGAVTAAVLVVLLGAATLLTGSPLLFDALLMTAYVSLVVSAVVVGLWVATRTWATR